MSTNKKSTSKSAKKTSNRPTKKGTAAALKSWETRRKNAKKTGKK